MWKQVIIKYVYSQITTSIKTDVGISEGTHQFEAYPPVTMYAIESILAKDILEKVIVDEDEKQDEVPENTEAENTEEAVESSEE